MSPTFKDAPAVLARHGIPPDADAAALLAELAARGWEARVEELAAGAGRAGGRSPRFRVLAIRPRAAGAADAPNHRGSHDHLQASGRTAAAALARVLAAALAGEG